MLKATWVIAFLVLIAALFVLDVEAERIFGREAYRDVGGWILVLAVVLAGAWYLFKNPPRS